MDTERGLGVRLEMRVQINVACGALDTQIRRVSSGRELVLVDHGAVVGETKMRGESLVIVAWTDVPGIRRLPLQRGIVGAPGKAVSLRIRVGVVRGDTESVECARQECEALLIGKLDAADVGIRSIDNRAGGAWVGLAGRAKGTRLA